MDPNALTLVFQAFRANLELLAHSSAGAVGALGFDMRTRTLLLLTVGLSLASLAGCKAEEKKEARTWNCRSLAVPGGETLECTTAALTADGPIMGDGETCEGSNDNPDLCPPDGTSDSGGSGGIEGSIYICEAGSADCPPEMARPGANTSDGSSSSGGGAGGSSGDGDGDGDDGATSDGAGASSGKGGAGGDGKGGKGGGGDDDGAGTSDGNGASSGAGGGGSGSTDGSGAGGGTSDGSGTSDGASGSGSKGGGAGSSETYECKKSKSGRIDCTRTTPECEAGTHPSGRVCAPDGSSDSGTGGSSTGGGAASTTDNGVSVSLEGEKDNGDGTKTWTYEVCELPGYQDLSNWVLATGGCEVVGHSPQSGFEAVSPDPNSGLTGVKWNTAGHSGCQTYTVTTKGGTSGLIRFSAKAPKVSYGMVQGPVCQ